MANIVNIRTLVDGPKYTVQHVYIRGDGTGDESLRLIADMSTFNDSPVLLAIESIKSSCSGCAGYLLWDATTDVEVAAIPEGHYEKNYLEWELLTNNAGAGVTGDILLTTVGLLTGSVMEICLLLRKSF